MSNVIRKLCFLPIWIFMLCFTNISSYGVTYDEYISSYMLATDLDENLRTTRLIDKVFCALIWAGFFIFTFLW